MKIVCLIRNKAPLVYFVNAVHARYPVSLVVIETPASAINQSAALGALYRQIMIIAHKIRRRKEIKRIENINTRLFGNNWRRLNEEIPVMQVQSVNDTSVWERLLAEKPDIILDHGTSIVKNHILETAPLALNIHWGLSPYYRGTNCTNWAILKRDPYNIGVTVHLLAKDVDGGDIFGQTRVIPEANDTARSINLKLTKAGAEIVMRALDRLSHGESLKFHHQDLSVGLLTRVKDYTKAHAQQITEIEKKGLSPILEHPSRSERLPIHEIN
ncbi:hypothetical protein HZB06_03060 [Candidatus Wolfebacteria bacterium]|nr:hypothetical protein [Candidatus Wolfebacteria bacterium]